MSNDLMRIAGKVKIDLQKAFVKMPKNYSFENAVKSAYLALLETKDKNGRPVLEVCTEESIYNSILDMAVQGLNPGKDQCSFVAYGRKLIMQREYPGSIAVAKRVAPQIKDIRAQPIYNGDKVGITIVNGIKHIKHEQDFFNLSKDNIIGAYAIAVDADENQIYTDVMTKDEIFRSWRQSKLNPVTESGKINPNTTHGKFPEEMVRKTIYNRLCKIIINTSDDAELLKSVERSDIITDDDEFVAPEPEPDESQMIDFAPRQEPQATKEQADKIVEIAKQIGELDYMLIDVSSFVQRDIKKLRELTEREADRYIEMKLKSIVQQPSQDETAGDEAPPWK